MNEGSLQHRLPSLVVSHGAITETTQRAGLGLFIALEDRYAHLRVRNEHGKHHLPADGWDESARLHERLLAATNACAEALRKGGRQSIEFSPHGLTVRSRADPGAFRRGDSLTWHRSVLGRGA